MQTNEVLKLDELMSIVLALSEKYKAERALLFGSYARGEATPDSDIDLVVFGGDGFHPTDIFALAEDLYEMTGKKVDVYEVREIDHSSSFYSEIMKDGVMVA